MIKLMYVCHRRERDVNNWKCWKRMKVYQMRMLPAKCGNSLFECNSACALGPSALLVPVSGMHAQRICHEMSPHHDNPSSSSFHVQHSTSILHPASCIAHPIFQFQVLLLMLLHHPSFVHVDVLVLLLLKNITQHDKEVWVWETVKLRAGSRERPFV